MAFAGSLSVPGMGTGLLDAVNWKAQRFSNPSGSYSANLSILARDQAGTKLPSLLLIPSLVPTGLGRPPALQCYSAWLKGSKKNPLEMPLTAPGPQAWLDTGRGMENLGFPSPLGLGGCWLHPPSFERWSLGTNFLDSHLNSVAYHPCDLGTSVNVLCLSFLVCKTETVLGFLQVLL